MHFYPSSLALGGGGLKGAAHIGVLQVFEEEGFPIEHIVGVSAGAVVGAAYAMGYSIEHLVDIIKEVAVGDVLDFHLKPVATIKMIVQLVLNMLKLGQHDTQLGLIRGKQWEVFLQTIFGTQTFEGLRYPLMLTAVDLRSGQLVIFTSKALAQKMKGRPDVVVYTDANLATAVQASTAIPGIFTPLHYHGRVLIDGGVKNMVPVDLLASVGARKVIGVELDSGEQEEEQLNDVLAVLLQTLDIMQEGMTELIVTRYADFVIHPTFRGISLTDFAKLEQVYQSGYQEAKNNVPALRELLGNQRFRVEQGRRKVVQEQPRMMAGKAEKGTVSK